MSSGKASEAKIIRPYGDTTGDGMVQLSFTLPIPHDKRAEGAAQQLANKMGIDPAMVVHAKAMGPDFTFFVVYGSVHHLVDVAVVVEDVQQPLHVVGGDLALPEQVGLRGLGRGLFRRLSVGCG